MSDLEARLARLEAKDAVVANLNRYVYGFDTGLTEDVIDAFAADAVLDVVNFPPEGTDMHFEGRDDIRTLYERYVREPTIGGGHHTANISVTLDDDLGRADLSAFFVTGQNKGMQGGRYEAVLRPESDGRWRFSELRIISSWGPDTHAIPASRSMRGGRPA